MPRRPVILHPTDLSPAAESAFGPAMDEARLRGGELLLLHVLEPVPALADVAIIARRIESRRTEESEARRVFDHLRERARAADIPAYETLVEGVPDEKILEVARNRRADLIVMGTHGRSGLGRLLLGSVAATVVAKAPCPVLTVRMQS